MGLFDRFNLGQLKMPGFFKQQKKQEEPEQETVEVDHLVDWYKMKRQPLITAYWKEVDAQLHRIAQAKEKLLLELKKLEGAELLNPNVQPKELEIMQGNRETYVKRVRQFSDKCVTPDEHDLQLLDEYRQKLATEIDDLSQSTLKSYAVLQHFFRNETAAVAEQLRIISEAAQTLQQLHDQSALGKLKPVQGEITQLLKKQTLAREEERELVPLEAEYQNLEQQRQKIAQERSQLLESPKYSSYGELLKKAEEIQKELAAKQQELSDHASNLDKAMRKYARMAAHHEPLIQRFLADPKETLFRGQSPAIAKVLEEMKPHLQSGVLDLKEKQNEKAMDSLNVLQMHGKEFTQALTLLMQQKEEAEQLLKQHQIGRDLQEINYKESHTQEKMKTVERHINERKAVIEKLNLEQHRQTVEEGLQILGKVKLSS